MTTYIYYQHFVLEGDQVGACRRFLIAWLSRLPEAAVRPFATVDGMTPPGDLIAKIDTIIAGTFDPNSLGDVERLKVGLESWFADEFTAALDHERRRLAALVEANDRLPRGRRDRILKKEAQALEDIVVAMANGLRTSAQTDPPAGSAE